MKRWRYWPVAVALLLSLLLHLSFLAGGLLSFEQVDLPADTPLRELSVKLAAAGLAEPAPVPIATLAAVAADNGVSDESPDASAPRELAKPEKVVKAAKKPAKPLPVIENIASATLAASAPASLPEVASAVQASTPEPVDASAVLAGNDEALGDKATKFPAAARLEYGLLNNGILLGRGEMQWQQQGRDYRILTQVRPIIGPRLNYESSGRIGKKGLLPEHFRALRDNQPREFAEFDRAAGVLRYGDKDNKQEPLRAGALDWLSMGFQLAIFGESGGGEPTQLTTGKKVYQFAVKVAGESDFDIGDKRIRVIVVRASNESELIEFWLAPDFANIPVRIVRADKDKRFELRATLIEFNGAVLWKQPPPKRLEKNEN